MISGASFADFRQWWQWFVNLFTPKCDLKAYRLLQIYQITLKLLSKVGAYITPLIIKCIPANDPIFSPGYKKCRETPLLPAYRSEGLLILEWISVHSRRIIDFSQSSNTSDEKCVKPLAAPLNN